MTKSLSWKTVLPYGIWIVVALLAFNLGRLMKRTSANPVSTPALIQSADRAAPIPYTLVRRSTLYAPPGEKPGEKRDGPRETAAVRSDGSWMERVDDYRGDRVISTSRIFLVSGKRIQVNYVGERMTSLPDAVPPQPERDARFKCTRFQLGEKAIGAETVEGEETVAGYRAIKVKRGMFTEWFAPELGCAKIKSFYDPPNGAHTVHELVSVNVGEPDPGLFTVPDFYEEVPPSKLYSLPGPDPLRMRTEDNNYALKNRQVQP